MDSERIDVLTRSAIALIVILGGGLTLIFSPDLSDKVIPVMTFVIGFYFSQAAIKSGASQAMSASGQGAAQALTIPPMKTP